MSDRRGQASIIIPAHDEAAVIDRCLGALTRSRDADGLDLEIVVVPNGCTDDTASIARSYPGVTVVEVEQAGKSGAIDAGDRAATTFPRIFLDADIDLEPGSLVALVAALDTPAPRVAAPAVRFDTTGSSAMVRAFYRVFERTPYVQDRLVGLGVYGLSRAGRARFDRFPALVADDLFIQRLFEPEERIVSPGRFSVMVPRDLRNLLRVRTRVARGNRELAQVGADDDRFAETTQSTGRALVDLVRRRPWMLPDVLVYVVVTLWARRRASRSDTRWERDESTRGRSAQSSTDPSPTD